MINNKFRNKLQGLSTGEVQVLSIIDDDATVEYFARVKFPYIKSPCLIQFIGSNYEELENSLIEGINQEIEDMIDHLGDCKL